MFEVAVQVYASGIQPAWTHHFLAGLLYICGLNRPFFLDPSRVSTPCQPVQHGLSTGLTFSNLGPGWQWSLWRPSMRMGPGKSNPP